MFDYLTSKDAILILANGESISWWFKVKHPEKKFFIIDYIPENYPSLDVGFCYRNTEDAVKRVKEMVENEGWYIAKGNVDDLKNDQEVTNGNGV